MTNRLFLICLILLVIAPGILNAQSGRRPTVRLTPTNTSAQTSEKDAARNVSDSESTPAPKEMTAMSSVIVAGEIVTDAKYSRSNYLDRALKECVDRLNNLYQRAEVATGSKFPYDKAIELAKNSDDSYVLWISFVEKIDSYGNTQIEHADYAILIPKTGKRLTNGRINPNKRSAISTGGILGLPNPRSNRSLPTASLNQMKEIARQIPDILQHGGWFGR
jgi:hypothetical protein